MNSNAIPLSFATTHCLIEWTDLLWGYNRGFLTWKDLVEFAAQRVRDGSEDDVEHQLSDVNKETIWKIEQLTPSLISKDVESGKYSQSKWLYLALKWAYDNRSISQDPLGEVERIYADFDYPSEIESFVRYMPASDGYDPSRHSKSENYDRLLGKWKAFVKG